MLGRKGRGKPESRVSGFTQLCCDSRVIGQWSVPGAFTDCGDDLEIRLWSERSPIRHSEFLECVPQVSLGHSKVPRIPSQGRIPDGNYVRFRVERQSGFVNCAAVPMTAIRC